MYDDLKVKPEIKNAAIIYLEAIKSRFDPDDEPERLLSMKQAAEILGITKGQFAELLLDPALPRVLLGKSKRVFVPRKELIEYISGRSRKWFEYA